MMKKQNSEITCPYKSANVNRSPQQLQSVSTPPIRQIVKHGLGVGREPRSQAFRRLKRVLPLGNIGADAIRKEDDRYAIARKPSATGRSQEEHLSPCRN